MYKKLKDLRKENNYTASYMADKLNISRTFYTLIENDKRRLTYDMAVSIANIFNKKPDEIFYDEFKNKDS